MGLCEKSAPSDVCKWISCETNKWVPETHLDMVCTRVSVPLDLPEGPELQSIEVEKIGKQKHP